MEDDPEYDRQQQTSLEALDPERDMTDVRACQQHPAALVHVECDLGT
jgi:hypothetical protein